MLKAHILQQNTTTAETISRSISQSSKNELEILIIHMIYVNYQVEMANYTKYENLLLLYVTVSWISLGFRELGGHEDVILENAKIMNRS